MIAQSAPPHGPPHAVLAGCCNFHNVHLVKGRIPWGGEAFLIAPEHRVICEPAIASKLASFTHNETHIGQHVPHPLGMEFGHNGRHPCE